MCALPLAAPRSTSQKFHSTCVPYTHTGESQCACECELHIKHTHTHTHSGAGSVGQRETNAVAAPLKKNTSCRSQRRCCCCWLCSRRRSCLLCIVSFALRHCRWCMTCGSLAEEDFVFLEKLLPKIALLFAWKLRTEKHTHRRRGEQLRSLQDSQVVSFV